MLWPVLLARAHRPASQESTAVGEAGKRSLSKGLLYQALAPAQERRLAQHHRNRQRGPLSLPGPPLIPVPSRAPPQLARPNFFISRAARTSRLVSASSAMLAMGPPWFDDREPSTKRLFLCFLCCSRRIKSLDVTSPTAVHDSPASSNQWHRQCQQECCHTFSNTRDDERALA
jgi:hypothetical protein